MTATARNRPVSDTDLLDACLSAGEPGTDSHRMAARVYRRSVLEWRGRDAEWRRAEAELIVRQIVAAVAEDCWMAVQLRRGLGGGHA